MRVTDIGEMAIRNVKDLSEILKAAFPAAIKGTESPASNRLYVDVAAGAVKDVSLKLVSLGGRFQISVGYDDIGRRNALGYIQTFAFDGAGFIAALRTEVPVASPELDSVAADIPGADWPEREAADLLGLKFKGHPKPKRLVLADDWPEGIHPLRKDVPYNLIPPAAEDVAYRLDEAPPGTTVVPVGPFHASLHEPEHFAVYVDGETIKGCDYRGFMVHRGIEKLCQTQVTYNEVPFIAERICGICGSVHAAAYAQAVEEAGGMTVSRRAAYIRTIMLEIERLHSHLLWIGLAGHMIGFDTVFMQAWRVRERIMWLSERITGNRKTYGMIIIGGVRRDITPEIGDEVLGVLSEVEAEVRILMKSVIGDTAVHRRTKGVGYLSKEDAVRWCLVGPTARARGIRMDVRKDHPYAAYGEMEFDVPVADSCDVWGTVVVRFLEIFESIRILRQALSKMPDDGPLQTAAGAPLAPLKHGLFCVEAPRGEVIHYVITGEENRPERWRVRAPTYPNLQAVPSMLMNNQFADFPIIVGSIDPCYSCTDRVAVIEIGAKNKYILDRNKLEEISRRRKT